MRLGQLDRLAQAWSAMLARGETPFDTRITWKLRTFAIAIISTALAAFVFGYILGGGR